MTKVKLSRKKVPIPPVIVHSPSVKGRPMKYPVNSMKVGWSFWVPLNGMEVRRVRAQIASALTRVKARDEGKEFTTRFLTENGEQGIRVWRVK